MESLRGPSAWTMLAWLSHLIRRPLPAGLVEDGSAFADGTIELRRLPDAARDEKERARKEGLHLVRLETP